MRDADAINRRHSRPIDDFYDLDGVLVDFEERTVLCHGRHRPLKNAQVKLLRYLLKHPNRVLGRQELLEALFRGPRPGGKRLDMQISILRRGLEWDPKRPTILVTVPGQGYRLNAEYLVRIDRRRPPGVRGSEAVCETD